MARLLLFEEGGQLAREGRLARTLQTGDQDDGRSAFQADVGGRAAHELRQLARRRISWVTCSGGTPNTWEAVTVWISSPAR